MLAVSAPDLVQHMIRFRAERRLPRLEKIIVSELVTPGKIMMFPGGRTLWLNASDWDAAIVENMREGRVPPGGPGGYIFGIPWEDPRRDRRGQVTIES